MLWCCRVVAGGGISLASARQVFPRRIDTRSPRGVLLKIANLIIMHSVLTQSLRPKNSGWNLGLTPLLVNAMGTTGGNVAITRARVVDTHCMLPKTNGWVLASGQHFANLCERVIVFVCALCREEATMNTNAKSTKCIVGDAPCFWGTSFSMEEKRGISMLRVAGDTASLPARLDLSGRKILETPNCFFFGCPKRSNY